MPSYEYCCPNCDSNIVQERSIHDKEPELMCETCGYRLRRVWTTSALQFKGGGFYSTGG